MAASTGRIGAPLRVLHIDTGRTWRGGQQQVALLHRSLLGLGVDSRLLARSDGVLQEHCRKTGLPVAGLRVVQWWKIVSLPRVLRATRDVDVVHAHDSHAAGLAALATWARPRLAFVCHRRVSFPIRGRPTRRLKYRSVRMWIAVTSEIARQLLRSGIAADRIKVVPSALDVDGLRQNAQAAELADLRRELGLPEGAPVVGVTAALEPHKGHTVLVRAAPGILKAVPETLFVCIGDGSMRHSLARQVVEAGIGARFRFAGFRSDPAAVTSLLTVAVAPSLDGEGSSAAIKEAMALGVAVVASDLEGHHEVAGDAAVFVPVGDPEALTKGVVQLLIDPGERARLAGRAIDRVEGFRPSAMVRPTVEIYRLLVAGGSSGQAGS